MRYAVSFGSRERRKDTSSTGAYFHHIVVVAMNDKQPHRGVHHFIAHLQVRAYNNIYSDYMYI
jgi:hypothetical protein